MCDILLKNNVTGKQYASYVPQDIYLTDNSIAENIAFGLNYNDINFMKLESILEKGILSHNDVAKQNLKIQDISNQSVQERRKNNYKFKKIVGNDRTLHDYTNLYWNPNNSMMSYLICNKQMYHDIVILDINASKLISSEKWIISDGNAASSTTNFYDKNSLNVKIVSDEG